MTQVTLISLEDLLEIVPNGEAARQVRQAYTFAEQAHHGRRRASGELYIDHDLAVAQILVQLESDVPTVVAGLLHDCLLPHTQVDLQTVKNQFGGEITNLIKGLQNLYAYAAEAQYQKYQQTEAATLEEIRRAILTIIEVDIRVILIRMADCLQDLRKAVHLPADERRVIALEAMNVFATLANRLGIWQIKWEMEDLAFRYLEPEVYKEIATKLANRRTERSDYIEDCIAKLQAKIKELGVDAEVTGRPKHIYSIHRKMVRKNVDFDEIYDVQALRVILRPSNPTAYAQLPLKEKEDVDRTTCYLVLGLVHSLWKPIPREFDDYIAAPKGNGYQSLHTAVLDPETGYKLEVQIRSQRMHEEAEKGVAAHWAYKENDGAHISSSVQRRILGLRDTLAALRESDGSLTDAEILATEVLADRIYVYTPKGDLIDLPSGSTPIDFAYQIHTEVGHRCRGAKVNSKMVGLDYRLKSGDRVEIITSKRGGPSRDWMNPVLGYTGRARTRSKIRQWFRNQEREQNIQQGRAVVERELRRLNLSNTYTVSDIAQALKYKDEDVFLAKVGFGDIQSAQISGAIALMQSNLKPDDELRPLLQPKPAKTKGLTVQGVGGLATKMAGCCQPIPPEPIVGFITRGQGITIHRRDCKEIENATERERIIKDVAWGTESETFPIPIVIKAYRRPGLIEDIVNILRGQKINSPRAKTTTASSISTVFLEVEVHTLEQLNWLMQKFETLPNVIEVYRQRWT